MVRPRTLGARGENLEGVLLSPQGRCGSPLLPAGGSESREPFCPSKTKTGFFLNPSMIVHGPKHLTSDQRYGGTRRRLGSSLLRGNHPPTASLSRALGKLIPGKYWGVGSLTSYLLDERMDLFSR